MKIGKTRVENFICYREAEIDFGRPGITCISGENGAGKSVLLSAPYYALFGQLLPAGPEPFVADDVRPRMLDATAPTYVSCEIELKPGLKAAVVRTRSKSGKAVLDFTVGGESRTGTTIADTQEIIERTLDCSATKFLHSNAYTATESVRSFLGANDAGRKAIMEAVLNVGWIGPSRKRAAERMRVARAAMRDNEAAIAEVQSELNTVVALAMNARDARQTAAKQRKTVRVALNDAKSEAAELKAAAEAADAAYRVAKSENTPDEAAYAKVEAAERKYAECFADVETAMTAKAEADSTYRQATKALDRLKAAPDVCPTCGGKMKRPKQAIREAATAQQTAGFKADAAAMDYDNAKRLADAADVELKRLRRELSDSINREAVDSAADSFRDAASKYSAAKSRVAELRERLAACKKTAAEADDKDAGYAKKAEKLDARLTALREATSTLERDVNDAEYAVSAFGDKGIRARVIEQYLPKIGRLASMYAGKLLGTPVVIAIQSVQSSDTGELIEKTKVSIDIPKAATKYGRASKGQRRCMDLGLALACRDVAAQLQPSPFNQLFVDELFDGLDATRTDSALLLLRSLTTGGNSIAVVSHDDRIRNGSDRIVVVGRSGDYSVIEK